MLSQPATPPAPNRTPIRLFLRDLFLRLCVSLGVTTAVVTELLSPFHLLRRGPVIFAWFLILPLAAIWCGVRPGPLRIVFRPLEGAIAMAIAAIVAVVAVTAVLSPPN